MANPSALDLETEFGGIDIYLFDQLQRRRLVAPMRTLDAGCGGGRNLVYLFRAGFDVCATDGEPGAVDAVRRLAATLAPSLPSTNFRVEPVERCSFADADFDVVVSSAVLHFARDEAHFMAMVGEMWRVLRPGGIFFCRLASNIGMESRVEPLGNRRFWLPDGSERFLVDAPMLTALTERLGGKFIDPIKTTVVHDQRCMTTWVTRKA